MKKIIFFITLVFVFALSSCVGFEYQKLHKTFTQWSSSDETFSFQMQGIQDAFGTGTIHILNEDVDVYVMLDVIWSEVILYDINDEEMDRENPLLLFDIEKGSLNGLTMTLITLINNTDDANYDLISMQMIRRDLTEEDEIDAKNYLGTFWKNEEHNWLLEADMKVYINHRLIGYIHDGEEKISVLFYFMDNQTFEIKNNGLVVITGTYETDWLSMTLNFTEDQLSLGYQTITLEAV